MAPPLEQLDRLEANLAESRASNVEEVQAFLDRLTGSHGFGAPAVNAELAQRINRLGTRYGLDLVYDGKRVSIRCLGPGSFQVRLRNSDQDPVLTSTVWPRLVAAAK